MGVPGELHGLRTAYEKFGGNIPWKRLFEPTIHMMNVGVPVSQGLEAALEVRVFLSTFFRLLALRVVSVVGDR